MKAVTKNEQFDALIEEIQSIFVEAEFASRWVMIEAHHKVGQLILGMDGDTSSNLQRVARNTGRSERSLWYSVKFAQTYKSADALPEGKNISWRKIIFNHLTTPKEKEAHVHSPLTICSSCRIKL